MSSRILPPPLQHGSVAIPPAKDAAARKQTEGAGYQKYAPPHRAQFNYIPSPDVLKTMIDRALEALSKGIYWDRGSIINLLL